MYKHLALALALTAAATLAVSTEGFSSVSADRQVSVEVVGDEDAYMSLRYADTAEGADSGESVAFVTVSNYFNQPVDLTVEYAVDSDEIADPTEHVDRYDDVGVGESVDVSTAVECPPGGTEQRVVSFDVSADGDSVYAETTSPRTVEYEVDCPDQRAATGVTFQGKSGNAKASGLGSDADRNATVWLLDEGEIESTEIEVPGSGNLRPVIDGDGAIAAVSLDETDTTYVHPLLRRTNGNLEIRGGSAKDADPICGGHVSPSDLDENDGELACP
ncbi:hypothetical protein ACFQL1_13120 [Halomicroarcula sp. GCM10025709]|uniref:hypothetical protein n=1 Tax=Haloarcula TaxID=2237 RepID=UPI0024C30A62|nr:hypothetical protein [Halomicroarcula sp. YJ-61-S]